MLRANGVFDVQVEQTQGFLSDRAIRFPQSVTPLAGCVRQQLALCRGCGLSRSRARPATRRRIHAAHAPHFWCRPPTSPACSPFMFSLRDCCSIASRWSTSVARCLRSAFCLPWSPCRSSGMPRRTRQTTPGDNRHRLARSGAACRTRTQRGLPDLSGRRSQFTFDVAVFHVPRGVTWRTQQRLR